MKPAILHSAFFAAAAILPAALVAAQAPIPELKVQLPLPHTEDVKTPAPPPPVKDAAPLVDSAIDSALSAGAPRSAGRVVGPGFLAGLERRVYVDRPGDGAVWAAGDAYKARFDAAGATFIPFFGSHAPRNYPVRFRVESVLLGGEPLALDASAEPVLDGDRVTFDRGSFREVYDLAVESIEQSFVFERMPGHGELVVHLRVETELERSADDQGLVLRGDLGSVRYTTAVAFDTRGERIAVPTAWSVDSIAIRVPAETIAAARFPLTIDPVVSTFNVDSNAALDVSAPDVAYDAILNRYLVVYERVFSASDHDIHAQLLNAYGLPLPTAPIDVTDVHWGKPKVANNGDASQFLAVAEVGAGAGARSVHGRTMTSMGLLGPQFVISGNESGEKTDPDVGGDPYAPPTFYCVVWQRPVSATDSDIHARLVRPDSTLVGTSTIYLDNSAGTLDRFPSISKTDGQGPSTLQDWNVVWTRSAGTFDSDIRGARIHWDGTITSPSFAVDTTSANLVDPSVSSPTEAAPRRYVVACTNFNALTLAYQTRGLLMEGTTHIGTFDLTALSGAPSGEDQIQPSIDCDGSLFVLANSESYMGSSTNVDVYASTFAMVGNRLAATEGHVPLVVSLAREDQVEIVTTGSAGGPGRRALAAWHRQTSPGNGDILGALYDADPFAPFCEPGAGGVIACPCGNNPGVEHSGCDNSLGAGGAILAAQGGVVPDTVVLTASGMPPNTTCLFFQGNGLIAAGAPFGDGVRCAGGALKRLYTKTASPTGEAVAPGVGEPSITARSMALGDTILDGTRRWYQAFYRNAANYACAPTFNVTGGVQIDW